MEMSRREALQAALSTAVAPSLLYPSEAEALAFGASIPALLSPIGNLALQMVRHVAVPVGVQLFTDWMKDKYISPPAPTNSFHHSFNRYQINNVRNPISINTFAPRANVGVGNQISIARNETPSQIHHAMFSVNPSEMRANAFQPQIHMPDRKGYLRRPIVMPRYTPINNYQYVHGWRVPSSGIDPRFFREAFEYLYPGVRMFNVSIMYVRNMVAFIPGEFGWMPLIGFAFSAYQPDFEQEVEMFCMTRGEFI